MNNKLIYALGIVLISLLAYAYLNSLGTNKGKDALNKALIERATTELNKREQRIIADSIRSYEVKDSLINRIKSINNYIYNERIKYKSELSKLQSYTTDSAYYRHNDSLYKYLQGAR